MQNKLFQKAKLNAFSGYINFAVSSVLVFFLNPLMVRYLGASTFGIWKSIQKILSFASIADGRATQALKWVIANDETNNAPKLKQQAVGSALKVWVYFLPLVFLVVFLLVWNLPSLINGIDKSLYPKIYQVGLILGANLLLNPLLGIPDAILVGTNNGYKSMKIQTIGVVVSNILMVVVSFLGYGLVGLGLVVFIVTLLNGLLIFYICKKNIPWMGIQKPSKEQVQKFFKFSFWVFIWSMVQKLILSTEVILIGYLIHPEVVTNYVFTTYIIQLAVSIALLTGSSITPGLGKLIGAHEILKAKEIVKNTREIILFVSLFFGAFILLVNKNFVNLWMGDSFYLGSYSNLLIVLIMINLVLGRIEGQIQDLSLKIKKKVITGAVFSILSVVFGIVGFNFFEGKIEGMFLGILIGRLLLNLVFSNMVNNMMKMSTNYFQFIYIILFLTGAFFLERYIPQVQSWWMFVLICFAIGVLLFVLCFELFLSNSSKTKIKQLALRKNNN